MLESSHHHIQQLRQLLGQTAIELAILQRQYLPPTTDFFEDNSPEQMSRDTQNVQTGSRTDNRVDLLVENINEWKQVERKYSQDTKLRAVQYVLSQRLSIKEVSKQLSIPSKNISRWIINGCQKLKGGGRKRLDAQMQEDLFKWIMSETSKGKQVQTKAIRRQAQKISNVQGFKASKGWFDKFCRRYNLRQRMQKLKAMEIDE